MIGLSIFSLNSNETFISLDSFPYERTLADKITLSLSIKMDPLVLLGLFKLLSMTISQENLISVKLFKFISKLSRK